MIRILKVGDNVGNRSKCWNLSARCQVDQNVEIWVKKGSRLMKMSNLSERRESKCWNLCANVGIDQNVEIWEKNGRSIKCWNLREKLEIDQMLIFYCKSGNQSKCWNLIENKEWIRILKFEDKKKVGNRSKCWNWSANLQIDQNVEIWGKRQWSIKMLKFECECGNRSKSWTYSQDHTVKGQLSQVSFQRHKIDIYYKTTLVSSVVYTGIKG